MPATPRGGRRRPWAAAAQSGERRVVELRSEQNKSLATEVEQGVDHLRLTVRGGNRAKDHLVAGTVGGVHDVLGDLSVEAVADVGRDSDQV